MIDKVGFALLHKGVIDSDVISRAIAIKEREAGSGQRSLAQILVSEFKVDHDAVFSEVAKVYAFKELRLDDGSMDERRQTFIKQLLDTLTPQQKQYLVEAKALPWKYDEQASDKLIIIAADPTHKHLPRIAYYFRARKYEVYFVRSTALQPHIEGLLRSENVFLESLKDIEAEIQDTDFESGIDEAALDQEINKSMLVNFFEGCLVEAVRQGASDIHIFPSGLSSTEFHFRVDGKLRVWNRIDGSRPEAVLAVVKDRSRGVDRFERDAAQDGYIQRQIDNTIIRFRVSVLPIVGSEYTMKYESVVIRVLDSRKVITDIRKIGFQEKAYEWFNKAIRKPQGMVILTGPTGSGKSTTLVAALYAVISPQVNVLTVEDPVEYVIAGARQIKIGPRTNFEQAIRAILRHDPDIVMVGEMRDKMTADIAIKLANTGHLTFSTLHTNDAPSAVTRLFKMGIEPFLIAYAINLIVAQRLVRRLCPKCKRPADKLDVAEALSAGFTEEEIETTTFYEPVGCPSCMGGYRGRAAIHESLYFSSAVRRAIFESGEEINEDLVRSIAVSEGMLTLRGSARERVKEGVTCIAEVVAATMEEES
ncbi:MAG: type II/IV secretion system protein [Ignavibacteriae bacterium]|nr:type II/IV secretion system protein [Ignavibacteriota bacterium]